MALQAPAFTRFYFDDFLPLVLTHGDISVNNVRLGGLTSCLGLYWYVPKWFEYALIMPLW